MTIETRLRDLEKQDVGSLTAHMTAKGTMEHGAGLSEKQRVECIRRMTDDELERSVAFLQAAIAIDAAKRKPTKRRR